MGVVLVALCSGLPVRPQGVQVNLGQLSLKCVIAPAAVSLMGASSDLNYLEEVGGPPAFPPSELATTVWFL
jgi:hypothetical protein